MTNKPINLTENILRKMIEKSVNQFLVNESVGNRKQVTRDEIIDLLNTADDSPINNGKFASVTYVKPVSVYKQKRMYKGKPLWRKDDVQSALDKYADRSGEDWHKNLTAFNQDDAKGNNPISTVVVAQRYLLHWISQEKFRKDYADYANKLSNLRMKYKLGLKSDGKLGDNHNQRQLSDTGAQLNQTNNLSRDFNMSGSKIKTTAYFVDENGNIVVELPSEVLKSMLAPRKERGPEKEAIETLSPEDLQAYAKAKAELDANFSPQNLLFDRILSIAISVNGQSYYYINDKLLTPIRDNGNVNVNQQEMVKIAEEQLGENIKDLMNFSKENHTKVFESKQGSFRRFQKKMNEGTYGYIHGYAPNEGNHMVGGEFGSWHTTGVTNIIEKFIDNLYGELGKQEEEFNKFEEYCYQSEDAFEVTADIDVDYDESTGYGSKAFPVYTIRRVKSKGIKDFIMSYPSDDENFKQVALKVLGDTINSLTEYDFDIDED